MSAGERERGNTFLIWVRSKSGYFYYFFQYNGKNNTFYSDIMEKVVLLFNVIPSISIGNPTKMVV